MKRIIIRILEVGLALMLMVGLAMMARTWMEEKDEQTTQEEAAELANLPAQFQKYSQESRARSEPDPNLVLLAQVDLSSLQAENPDVIGWICIPDTELSYPLVQGTDNAFYLNHTWRQGRNSAGAIFMERSSSADFGDYHTIIYGHRMNNDSMFGTLKYYDSLEFWQEHPSVYVVTADSARRYDIFSAQEAGIKDILYRLDIEEKHLEEELIQYCVDGSAIDTGLVPETDDPILTLSTCTRRGRTTRWVVHGVLGQAYKIVRSGPAEQAAP